MADFPSLPRIPEFYAGKNIFLTGATGFIGKVLLEKVLRSCPDVKGIYILIRPKKTQNINQRVEKISKCQVFDRLRKEQPRFSEKVIPIHGDVTMPNLGINQDDRELLRENIHIVIHSAATIKFDEPLRVAVEINVLAVRKMINLAQQLKHLESFVHVSTAFANCDRASIEETVYDPPVDPQKLIETLEWMDDEAITQITPKLLGNKPNTYTYSKHIAESLLLKEGQGLPLAIVRPSIVLGSMMEPMPGWIDSFGGPCGLFIAVGQGILRSMKIDLNAVADMIPVDFCVNTILAVAWHTAVMNPSSCLIYNCTTSTINPVTWGDTLTTVMKTWRKFPLDSCFRRPYVTGTLNRFSHDCSTFLHHFLPAYLVDFGSRMVGRKPRMVKLYNRLHKSIDVLEPFSTNSWEWSYSNIDMLSSQLHSEDRKNFCFDVRTINWQKYLETICVGIKKFILKQDLSNVPAAKAHLRKLRNINFCINTMLLVSLYPVLSTISGLVMPYEDGTY